MGEIFYEPLMQFMIGQDPCPRIYTESGFKALPNGRRAHEMPDKVTEWLSFLRDLKENFDRKHLNHLIQMNGVYCMIV